MAGWAFGLLVGDEVHSWEGEYKRHADALTNARIEHGDEADLMVAWIVRLTYAELLPDITDMLAEMKERVAEADGDTTCFDLLSGEDILALETELRAVVEVWEQELPGWEQRNENTGELAAEELRSKHCTAVKVENAKHYPPEITPAWEQ